MFGKLCRATGLRSGAMLCPRSIALCTHWSIEEVVWCLDLRVEFCDRFKNRACHLFRTKPALTAVTTAARLGVAAGLPQRAPKHRPRPHRRPMLPRRALDSGAAALVACCHALARSSHRRGQRAASGLWQLCLAVASRGTLVTLHATHCRARQWSR